MGDVIKNLVELLNLAPKYMAAISAVAAILLFTPAALLQSIGVRDFTQANRHWVGLVFLGSTTLFVIDRIMSATDSRKGKGRKNATLDRQTQRLDSLTEDEKQILRYYIHKQTRTNYLLFDDGVVQGLAAIGVIYRASSMGNILYGFAYNISDFAWDYLNENWRLLDGTTNLYRNDKESRERRW
jgi:hypothetical protein